MSREQDNVIFPAYPIGRHPNSYVRTAGKGKLLLGLELLGQKITFAVPLSRRHARLLARRINQCLDATK